MSSEMKPINKNEIWTHSRTGKPYFIVDKVKAKLSGEWVDEGIVIYRNGIGETYARTRDDFLTNFEKTDA